MTIDFNEITHLVDPSLNSLLADFEQFLLSLTGPTVIDIGGVDDSRTIVITTLLQGNEPSGFIAIHRWLTDRDVNIKPKTNMRFILCSVEAASKRPLFIHRSFNSSLNINRCFTTPAHLSTLPHNEACCYERARLIEQAIREVSPIVIIDLHNATSPSPAYAISAIVTNEILSLTGLFCQSLVLSDLTMGSLMEVPFDCPFITIECGYKDDIQSHERAYWGISELAKIDKIDSIKNQRHINVKYKPLRLCLKDGTKLAFANADEGFKGVTLKSDIDYFNFGHIYQDEMIGWVDSQGLNNLQLIDKDGTNIVGQYFYVRENKLLCKNTYQLLKATSNVADATSDCLFYVTRANTMTSMNLC
ncbi:MAG: hypothetical protein ACPGTQ_05265 [Colwellia sp.]